MGITVGASDFRKNISKYLDQCDTTPLIVNRHSKMYIVMSKEHYIDLINKIKMPNLIAMPPVVQTIVHFKRISG